MPVAQLAITKLQATQLSPALFKYVVVAFGHKQSDPDASGHASHPVQTEKLEQVLQAGGQDRHTLVGGPVLG